MTDSAVLNTVLGLVFLFYALALLCSGLVEMIANWVKKRAKYLLRGIRELIDDVVPADVAEADRNRMQRMPTTAQTALLNGMIERWTVLPLPALSMPAAQFRPLWYSRSMTKASAAHQAMRPSVRPRPQISWKRSGSHLAGRRPI